MAQNPIMRQPKVLILGGTTEASALAAWLAGRPDFHAMLSFAGTTKAPRPPPIPYRIGGFGGADGLATFLTAGGFTAMIDATHPFAAQMKRHAAQAAARTGIAATAVLRPGWTETDGDRWLRVADMTQAATALGIQPRRVLLTIGQKDLAAFRNTHHRTVLRSVDPPPTVSLPEGCSVITARGPFDVDDERVLLRNHSIEILVTKDSGGTATQPKLEAARQLGLQVVMVDRPPPPQGVQTLPDADAAIQWLLAHARTERGE
eukprot:gene1883-1913_t